LNETSTLTTRYHFEPAVSRFTVQTFATGLLSFAGHNPTFVVRDFEGSVTFENDMIANMRMELIVRAGSLAVTDEVKPSDRGEIEGRMRRDVLDIAAFPDIVFLAAVGTSERIGDGCYRLSLDGSLMLRGYKRPHHTQVELTILTNGIRLKGSTELRISDYRIQPVSALGGMLRLKDEIVLTFDLGAKPEVS
jgi:polyisoprenoid-binding protein YceI